MKFVLSTAFTTVSHVPELAVAAEAAGWSMIGFSDHVVNPETLTTPYPYTPDGSRRWPEFTEWPDPLVTIGALATITKTLRFTTNVFVLPMRNPFLVAKALATLSVLSGNRVVPALGVGWSSDEFGLLQQEFRTRGRRCDEMVEVMRLLWTGEYVSYHGKHYAFDRVEMNPKPAGRIPLWVGGISDAALRRAARLGDGWLSDLQPAAEIVDMIGRIRAMRRELGRDGHFDVMATPMDAFGPDAYRRLEEQGVTHILMQPWALYHPGTQDLRQKKDSIRRFADEVIARCA
jgi:probable F420-dependent oxidoreductase